jgi:thiamine biosynthesis lipoprotein
MRKLILLLATAVVMGLAFLGWWRTAENREISRTEFLMGTYIEAKAYGRRAAAALDQVYIRLQQIEQRMTINQAGSEIDNVNDQAGQQPVSVSEDTFAVVKKALEFAQMTSGKFDPTIQPIVALWRIGSPEARVPAPSEIASRLPLVNYQLVQLDESTHSIFLPVAGMGLDLGGIAKGYAADEAISTPWELIRPVSRGGLACKIRSANAIVTWLWWRPRMRLWSHPGPMNVS